MIEAVRRRGYAYQVLTDHTQSLAIARGLTPDRVAEQAEVIAALNARFAAEEAAGTAPPGTPAEGFRLLHGCELEVRADGRLDFEDDLLARFDVVVASVHVSRRQTRAELTKRTLNAIRSPHVDVIAHPSGRKIGRRDDLDLDWDVIYSEAARTGTALEMNGSPPRLDLAVERARRAVALGCVLAIDSDAHDLDELDFVRWGISQARRAWVTPRGRRRTRGRGPICWPGRPASRGACERLAYHRGDGRPLGAPRPGPRRGHRRRVVEAARAAARLGRRGGVARRDAVRDPPGPGRRGRARSGVVRRRDRVADPAVGRRGRLPRGDPARPVRAVARAGARADLAGRDPDAVARGAHHARAGGACRGRPDRAAGHDPAGRLPRLHRRGGDGAGRPGPDRRRARREQPARPGRR